MVRVASVLSLLVVLAVSTVSAFTGASLAFRPKVLSLSGSALNMVADDAKVCLVTGASRGLGRAIALELGKAGCKVVVNYAVSDGPALQVVDEIKKLGGDAIAVKADCK